MKIILLKLAIISLAACSHSEVSSSDQNQDATVSDEHTVTGENIPEWAENVVWYQIFPERFRQGDSTNNPTADRIRDPLGFDLKAPDGWEITPWTSDWYQRADWEQRIGPKFFDSVFSRRYGGDLQGVIDKLDYLEDLGVTAIYFNPIFDAVTMHKYDASYYHHIDRFFGPDPEGDAEIMAEEDPNDPDTWQWTSADKLFLELIEKAHDREIRIVLDGVWNHTGPHFWAFQDIVERGEDSDFVDWYQVNEFGDEYDFGFDYEGWWGYPGLPEFTEVDENLHTEVKQHIFDVTKRWMAPDGDPDRGIDGWRLDVPFEVGNDFWRDWHEHVHSIKDDVLTIAETWDDGALDLVADDMFGAVMNYRWTYATSGFFINQTISADELDERLEGLRDDFTPANNRAMQNLMDGHDTERLATQIVNADNPFKENTRLDEVEKAMEYDVRKPNDEEWDVLKLVSLFQFTYVGSPMVYYGSEAGMWGADDPDDRKPMVWPDLEYDDEVNHPYGLDRPRDEVSFNNDLHEWYTKLGELRSSHDVLGTGDFKTLYTGDDEQVFVYARYHSEDEWAIVALNREEEPVNIEGDLRDFNVEADVRDILTGASVQVDENMINLELDAVSGAFLVN